MYTSGLAKTFSENYTLSASTREKPHASKTSASSRKIRRCYSLRRTLPAAVEELFCRHMAAIAKVRACFP
jgi:hypothetical protein